ncbi:p-aminobenzoyl-glutamate transporter [Actinosynnema sp. ALI-1.44]|uniref:AbgT family transporter n=1 Tax=Actinosynnema sp. ALI-1.44 TaxID=1933779 RepID=UPI00097BBC92|nr:AbgT family transporter [Actinosynnema sp. ALI-1.44]ONI84115.1 p-aminobenzoyl-glutamate transporter [Actinosynnema sp. ALI-1.44]
MSGETKQRRSVTSFVLRVLDVVDRVGNKLPHPFWLFVIMSVLVVLASWILSLAHVSVVSPADGKTIGVRSLVSDAGVQMILGDLIKNFVNFPPLGLIVVVMLGVAVADKTGLLPALMRAALAKVPAKLVTFAISLTAMFAQIASDAAFVVMIPLAMIAFRAVGRSPVIGAVVAYVSVGGASSIGLVITGSDAIFAGLTTSAAHTIDPDYLVTPVSNYYFSVASSLLLAVSITVITELVVAKRVAAMNAVEPELTDVEELPDMTLSAAERKGVRRALLAAGAYVALVVLAMVPSGSPLRGEGGSIVNSPLMNNIAVILMLFFMIIGAVYGVTVGTMKSPKDFPDLMGQGLRELVPVLVLFFAVSQFLGYFKWTNIGQVIAISGARALDSLGAQPVVIFIGAVLLISLMNLLLTSGSAMYALVAPVLVPMLMLLHIQPETTQALFRIADAPTNSVTPMSPYFVIALGFIRRYRPSAGVGTLMSLVLPIAVVNLCVWLLMFLAWYGIGLPLGPGVPVR